MQQFLSICAQHMKPNDLMMVLNMIQEVNNEDGDNDNEETVDFIADELQTAKPMTAYYADLMCLCYFLNWNLLFLKRLESKLFECG